MVKNIPAGILNKRKWRYHSKKPQKSKKKEQLAVGKVLDQQPDLDGDIVNLLLPGLK